MDQNMETPDPNAGGAGRDGCDAQSGQAARIQNTTAPAPLEPCAAIWCSWRTEPDAKTGRPTKVPYVSRTRKGRSNAPETWITHAEAQRIAADPAFASGAVNGLCGVAVFLGAGAVPDAVLCGVDVDTRADSAAP